MKKNEKRIENSIYLVLLFIFTIHSLIFNFSAKYSSILLYFGLIIGPIITNVFFNRAIKKEDIKQLLLTLLLILPITLYGYKNHNLGPNAESIRYGLFFLIWILWTKRKIKDLTGYHIFLILLGLVCCFFQMKNGVLRPSGFLKSPTIFSCTISISISYLLFEKKFKRYNLLFIIIGIYEIFLTGASSSMLLVLLLILYKIMINVLISKKEKNNDHLSGDKSNNLKILIIIMMIVSGCVVFNNLDFFLSIIQRNNREASTTTRLNLINTFIDQFTRNLKTLLIGNGGGFTRDYIVSYITSAIHMPLHQDFLMLLCEYGIIGMIYIYIYFLKKMKINYIMLVILLLCSFHNIILAPYVICLFAITNNALNIQYNEMKIFV